MSRMITTLIQEFKEIRLNSNRTLFECDFFDTHYRYFEEVDKNYLLATGNSIEELVLNWGFNWNEYYTNLAIDSIFNSKRPDENFLSWDDVSLDYLTLFSQSVSFLSPQGFRFFYVSAIYQYLINYRAKDCLFIYDFNLSFEANTFGNECLFNEKQIDFIENFLELINE